MSISQEIIDFIRNYPSYDWNADFTKNDLGINSIGDAKLHKIWNDTMHSKEIHENKPARKVPKLGKSSVKEGFKINCFWVHEHYLICAKSCLECVRFNHSGNFRFRKVRVHESYSTCNNLYEYKKI